MESVERKRVTRSLEVKAPVPTQAKHACRGFPEVRDEMGQEAFGHARRGREVRTEETPLEAVHR